MLLRDHVGMTYKGIRSWPPGWVWLDGPKEEQPKGEVGILRSVLLSKMHQAKRCFLLMSFEGSSYLGCLLFDDHVFCSQIVSVLQKHCNQLIAEIGSLDLSSIL